MLLPPALGFSPHPPVSVYGTGTLQTIAAFLDGLSGYFATLGSLRITQSDSVRAFLPHLSPCLHRAPLPAYPYLPCPRSSAVQWCRNINLLSIDYAFQPRLRPRLPQGRSALPWIPWIFGLKDSSPSSRYSFRHSLFMTLRRSLQYGFAASSMLPYQSWKDASLHHSSASVVCFSPGNFRRGTSRPVSYYALFECMAASEPTSWLSGKSYILFHLTHTSGP